MDRVRRSNLRSIATDGALGGSEEARRPPVSLRRLAVEDAEGQARGLSGRGGTPSPEGQVRRVERGRLPAHAGHSRSRGRERRRHGRFPRGRVGVSRSLSRSAPESEARLARLVGHIALSLTPNAHTSTDRGRFRIGKARRPATTIVVARATPIEVDVTSVPPTTGRPRRRRSSRGHRSAPSELPLTPPTLGPTQQSRRRRRCRLGGSAAKSACPTGTSKSGPVFSPVARSGLLLIPSTSRHGRFLLVVSTVPSPTSDPGSTRQTTRP